MKNKNIKIKNEDVVYENDKLKDAVQGDGIITFTRKKDSEIKTEIMLLGKAVSGNNAYIISQVSDNDLDYSMHYIHEYKDVIRWFNHHKKGGYDFFKARYEKYTSNGEEL